MLAIAYVHSKLAQVDDTAEDRWIITGVRFWTEEEWLAHRDPATRQFPSYYQKRQHALVVDEKASSRE